MFFSELQLVIYTHIVKNDVKDVVSQYFALNPRHAAFGSAKKPVLGRSHKPREPRCQTGKAVMQKIRNK